MSDKRRATKPIILTSHPAGQAPKTLPIMWGARSAIERGPIIATLTDSAKRNCIGTHSGGYSVYRALAVASKALDPLHIPDLTNTAPTTRIGPYESWYNPLKIVSMDPWGADIAEEFGDLITAGYNIQPTIAITRAHITMPEIVDAVSQGRLSVDGDVLLEKGLGDLFNAGSVGGGRKSLLNLLHQVLKFNR